MTQISIVLPARNEAAGLMMIMPALSREFPDAEIIVVNDSSTDDTGKIAEQYGARLITHPYTMGNGAAIKTGARAATGDVLVFMDADGQHNVNDIGRLLDALVDNIDMVVGARNSGSQAGLLRWVGNCFYNKVASFITGHKIDDLTSGFRVVRREKFLEFINILPNGFSYPTTITMAFFRVGYTVKYVSIEAARDAGKSHINLFRDGIKFLLIIFRITALYSPLKIFFPASFLMFVSGIGYYCYTFFFYGRFTNMSSLLLLTSILIFLIGLVSEQITFLIYANKKGK